MIRRYNRLVVLTPILAILLLLGCLADQQSGSAVIFPTQGPASVVRTITLGDIDAYEPTKIIKRFQPLADYLAQNLIEFGIGAGNVVVARNFEEMARFLTDGTVDVYFDSSFPTLSVQELAGSQIIARRWKQGDPTYWSTYIVPRNGEIESPKDFMGKIIAFEEPYSTSGFLLPAGTLLQPGFNLKEVDGPDAPVGPDEIGYFFSRDEENTVELILQHRVAGGGVSNQDYQELPPELKDQIVALDRTIAVPRQLVSVRAGLEPELVNKIRDLLINLEHSEPQLLENLKNTRRFYAVSTETEEALDELREIIKLVSE